jgi:altronate hydrolase
MDRKWLGYLRPDGQKGIRNKVLVLYTVECAALVAQKIAAAFTDEVDVIGFAGCTESDYAVRMLAAAATHPNVGAVLAVGLGCEYIQPSELASAAKKQGRLADWFFIQETGGTTASIAAGCAIVGDMLKKLKSTPRIEMGFCDLVVGSECGGSDFTSGLAGNVVVGRFFDFLVDCGGSAVFEEIVEAVGLRNILCERGKTERARRALMETYDKAMDYCKRVDQYSISPGNFVGGLTTIEEKSMGALVKSGSRGIEGVIKVSQSVPHRGLWLLDSVPDPHDIGFGYTNPNDNEGLMDLVCAGCHLLLFTTGRGNVVGSAVAPVIKITGNRETFEKLKDDMDFDASPVLSGDISLDELTSRLTQDIVQVCGGAKTRSEILGHKEYYIPYKYQKLGCERE